MMYFEIDSHQHASGEAKQLEKEMNQRCQDGWTLVYLWNEDLYSFSVIYTIWGKDFEVWKKEKGKK